MIGERVRHARDFCGLTQVELSDLSGIPQSRISEIEAGRDARPAAETVASIARATSFPVEFFYKGALPDLPDGNFRRLKRGKVRATKQVRAQARHLIELVEDAEKVITFPPLRLEPVRAFDGDVDTVAENVRASAGVGYRDPIPNLTRAVERAGVVVAPLPGEIPDHYGFSAWPDFAMGGRPVIVYSSMDPGDRQRFTVGHELAHLLLHSPLRDDELDADQAEREADAFAGALLLPREAALDAMRPPLTLHTLSQVKATFGISIGAGAARAKQLGLISEDRFVSLRKQISSRGWNRREPVDVPNEQPMLIRQVLDLFANGDSVSDRASSAGLPVFAYRAMTAAAG